MWIMAGIGDDDGSAAVHRHVARLEFGGDPFFLVGCAGARFAGWVGCRESTRPPVKPVA